MAKSITKRTLVGFRTANVNTHYFEDMVRQITQRPEKFIAKIKKGQSYWKANNNNDMKFNAIVGNPPYQDSNENTSDTPIYNHFYDISFRISDKVTFITPGRFLFNAGKTPKDWNKKILSDKHFKVIWYESDSTKIFPNVDIKGGVAVTFRDVNKEFGQIGIFSNYKELGNISKKILEFPEFKSIKDIIYLQNKFNLDVLYKDYLEFKNIVGSNGKEKRLTSPIFEQLSVFTENKSEENDVQIFGLINNKRVYRWLNKKYLLPHENLEKFKVFVPKANGSGKLGEELSSPLIGKPFIGFTFSFISFGSFDKIDDAENTLKYLKTKFTRALLGVLKVTQDNLPNTWAKVPVQNFTVNSDIDWTKSISEIDQQLYKKYQLSAEEVAFIENMIKPMA